MGKNSTRQDLPLSGYADRLSARPGESLDIKVSSLSKQPYQASLVRVWEGTYPSREQKFFPGSYGRVDSTGSLCSLEDFSALITLWPTRPGTSEQTLISHQDSTSGWSLFLDDEGCLAAELGKAGDTQKFRLEGSLRERKWYQAWLTYDAQTSKLTLGKAILDPGLKSEDQTGSSS
ncbi:MAG: hypothetical protein EBT88_09635, partial [Proteobacteria bacterium]|nr:hypothetical protein [Pseudomonadota bacterium]